MGSAIICITRKNNDFSAEELKISLQSLFANNSSLISHQKNKDNWWMKYIEAENGEPSYITGEGGDFIIDSYKNVICITSIERFGKLYLDEDYATDLYNTFIEIVKKIGDTNFMLLLSSNDENADRILNFAYHKQYSYEEIQNFLVESNGEPARTLKGLKQNSWFIN